MEKLDFAYVLRSETKKNPAPDKMDRKLPNHESLYDEIKESCLLAARKGQDYIVLKDALSCPFDLEYMVLSGCYERVVKRLRADGLSVQRAAPSIIGMMLTLLSWAPKAKVCEEESQRKIVAPVQEEAV